MDDDACCMGNLYMVSDPSILGNSKTFSAFNHIIMS